ncbi:hypothetical protein EVA_05404 [gut metagenome]|uniref:Uncharacterized protein n=1 Tax=gut metagenome TaxID=749906 RepID=J9GUK3_9ZZZZ
MELPRGKLHLVDLRSSPYMQRTDNHHVQKLHRPMHYGQ